MILGLVAVQLGEWLPEAVTPVLAVCHPEDIIGLASDHIAALQVNTLGMSVDVAHPHAEVHDFVDLWVLVQFCTTSILLQVPRTNAHLSQNTLSNIPVDLLPFFPHKPRN